MKASKTPKAPTTNDGTPFPIRFEREGFLHLKLCGNNKRALYSRVEQKTDKLKGFYVMQGKNFDKVNLQELNFKHFQK
jgi:hypothetical protein